MTAILAFVLFVAAIMFSCFIRKDMDALISASYYVAEKAVRYSKDNEKRIAFFKENMQKEGKFFLPFFKRIFLRDDGDFLREFNNSAPMAEAKLLSEEILEKDTEEKIKFELEKKLLFVLTKINNKQFYDQPDLVSKDQVREVVYEEINSLNNIKDGAK